MFVLRSGERVEARGFRNGAAQIPHMIWKLTAFNTKQSEP